LHRSKQTLREDQRLQYLGLTLHSRRISASMTYADAEMFAAPILNGRDGVLLAAATALRVRKPSIVARRSCRSLRDGPATTFQRCSVVFGCQFSRLFSMRFGAPETLAASGVLACVSLRFRWIRR